VTNSKSAVLFVASLLVAVFLLTGSVPSRSASATPSASCKQWEIKLVPAKNGKVEAGWEPISGSLYGEGGDFGVLLRRCAG
jgi:ABC-type phosphate/phosphonate transport system substrate-binding protein